MILLSHMGQPCLGTSRLVPVTSQIGQSFLRTNQAILLLIKKRKMQAAKLFSITPHVSHSDLLENCYDCASSHVSQSRLGSSWYVATSSQIGRLCLRTSETLQRRLKQVRDGISAWSGTFKLIFKMCQFHLSTRQYILAASQVVQSHLGTNKSIAKTSQRRQSDLGTSWYFVTTSQIGWFYLRINEVLQRRIKWIRLIDVPVATS